MQNKTKTYITYEQELYDQRNLIRQIRESGWVQSDMVIINCAPEYSSRLVQLANHKLSSLNGHELYEVMDFQVPPEIMSQVWHPQDRKYQQFDKYMYEWCSNLPEGRYLFLSSDTHPVSPYQKIRLCIKNKLENEDFRFGTIYNHPQFKPDFLEKQVDGEILYQWENMDNPNWGY